MAWILSVGCHSDLRLIKTVHISLRHDRYCQMGRQSKYTVVESSHSDIFKNLRMLYFEV